MESLKKRVLEKMVEQLDLEEVDVENYNYDAPIFFADEEDVPGLGLDSIDALELVVAVHDEFGIKIPVEEMSELRTVTAVAEYIKEKCEHEK